MNSRQQVAQLQQQQQSGGVIIKPKNAGGERKNRRALGDIGNVVTVRGVVGVEGKPLVPKVSRPVTRTFCAQLLADAQAAAAQNKNKNANGEAIAIAEVALPDKKVEAAAAAVRIRKPTQKKAAAKPKPEEIIEISPDSTQIVDKDKSSVVDKAAENSSKKKAPTLTSTLTARSKAACGLSKKPKEQIVDIDVADLNNDLAVVEYVEDMYKYYKSAENEGRVHNYIDSQPDINEKMRAILIDWLVQVHEKFELSPETLYLTINIVDRYLASKTTMRRELQLVGLSALLIASKYEEIWAPEVEDLVCISDRTYTNQQVLVMEKSILGELEWMLTVPTPYVFLVRFIKASQTESDVENMVHFLAELGMMNYATLIYCPSRIAASAVYTARCALNKSPAWNDTLKLHTGFCEAQLMDCAKLLATFHSMATTGEQKLRGIYKKYSRSDRWGVALLPPPKSLLGNTN